jgi:murein DD-endopeptidase MepM/ murein hydrolase activator NlpD
MQALGWSVNCAVAALVLSLPIAASASSASGPSTQAPELLAAAESPRAQSVARGTIAAGRSAVTASEDTVRPIREYTMGRDDTLGSMSNFFGVSPESIAFANGISDPLNLEVGRSIRIPPADGALYTVAEADTVESVAVRFKVDAAAIKDYNRLHFEPEHFATGQLIFVPGADLPKVVYRAVDAGAGRPTLIARAAPVGPVPAPATPPGPSGSWPVAGVITQYMSSWHTGVDIAAPFGTSLVAVTDGTVTATGWVAVGGLRVCVTNTGVENCYYHTSAVFVSPGEQVERGQAVAAIGLSGVTTGPHVHWETKVNGVFVNPLAR